MTQKEVKQYVKALGLENKNNVVAAAEGPKVEIESEQEMISFVTDFLYRSLFSVGWIDSAPVYVCRLDRSIQLAYLDLTGVIVTKKSLKDARNYTEKYVNKENYMLLIETEPNIFSVVSKKYNASF